MPVHALVGMIGLPPDASEHGARIDALLVSTARHAGLVFAVALAWLAFWVLRSARRPPGAPDEAPPRQSRASGAALVGLAALVSGGLDAPLLLRSLRDLREVFGNFTIPAADPRAIRVEVTARRWTWEARLAGSDGQFGTPDDVVSPGEIPVARGVPVHVALQAVDVVHAFSLPNLRVKADVIPGHVTETWFQARRTGRFEIACQQFCGPGHALMRGELVVREPQEHAAWLARASSLASVAHDPAAPPPGPWPLPAR